jgi:hypothetical protein
MTGIRHPEESAVMAREPLRRYDLVKEFVIAFVVVSLLTVFLSALFSSPDVKPITLKQWAKADPNDFVATAVTELAGTSGTAGYGPPYNNTSGASQTLGPIKLQQWVGVTIPINAAQDFVLRPLASAPHDPALASALAIYQAAPASQQQKWASDYSDALAKAPDGNPSSVKPGDYGPVPILAGRLLDLARSSALDGTLMSQGGFYQTDYTKSVLFLADSSYLEDRASAQHLAGEQWGMMNETGNFPGQAWLWLYTFWYQIKPFSTSDNADAWIWWLMALLSLVLVLVPFIPGLRSLPRYLGIYRLIWRDYYRAQRAALRR